MDFGDNKYVMSISQSEPDSPDKVSQEANIEKNSAIDQEDGIEPIAKKMKEVWEALMTKLRE